MKCFHSAQHLMRCCVLRELIPYECVLCMTCMTIQINSHCYDY
jgi:hypothetical protein